MLDARSDSGRSCGSDEECGLPGPGIVGRNQPQVQRRWVKETRWRAGVPQLYPIVLGGTTIAHLGFGFPGAHEARGF